MDALYIAIVLVLLLVAAYFMMNSSATPATATPTTNPTTPPSTDTAWTASTTAATPDPSTPGGNTPSTPGGNTTPTNPDGSFCTDPSQCTGGFCNQFKCKSTKPGGIGSKCNVTSDCAGLYCSNGLCSGSPREPIGGTCSKGSDCASNYCISGECAYNSTPSQGTGCNPTSTVTSGECREVVFGSGEYFLVTGGGLDVASGSCPSVHSFIQPSTNDSTKCYYPRPIGAPCTTDDMCPGWTTTTTAGSLCVTGTCVNPAGFISGSQTCDPYVGPFCGNNKVCIPGQNGAANTCQAITGAPSSTTSCDLSGLTCGSDGTYMCEPYSLKCRPTNTLQVATNGFGVPAHYYTVVPTGVAANGQYFSLSNTTNPNAKGYTGADMINACITNPSSCVAAGFAGVNGSVNNYWPVAAPTSATSAFISTGSFYPNIVY